MLTFVGFLMTSLHKALEINVVAYVRLLLAFDIILAITGSYCGLNSLAQHWCIVIVLHIRHLNHLHALLNYIQCRFLLL